MSSFRLQKQPPKELHLRDLFSRGALWNARRETSGSLPAMLAPFGITDIDAAIGGGLPKGFIHEFALENTLTSKAHCRWQSPLFVAANLLRSLLLGNNETSTIHSTVHSTVWIGRQCWPTPVVLEASISSTLPATTRQRIKDAHIFLDPTDQKRKLWSIVEALRAPTVAVVIADGSKLNSVASRRIQLAAQERGAFCLLMRPPWELAQTSTAYSRWRLRSVVTPHKYPAWEVELLRFRGVTTPQLWSIELYEENTIRIFSNASNRTDQTEEEIPNQSEAELRSSTAHKRTA